MIRALNQLIDRFIDDRFTQNRLYKTEGDGTNSMPCYALQQAHVACGKIASHNSYSGKRASSTR